MIEFFEVDERISLAIRRQEPVVVIESVVWVHGLPPEDSIKTLQKCAKIIEEEGALPAVVVLYNGKIVVGECIKEIQNMIEMGDCRKVNVRDIPSVLQKNECGATTVSSTLMIASLLGLPVAMTGGIGGVHRRAEVTFDVSSDLYALANYPVTLVSSGVKSVLNVGATLEKLETLGVPVLCYNTDVFPAFYCRLSKYPAPEIVTSVEEIAETVRIYRSLGQKGGILVANPIPERDALSETFVEEVTEKALMEAEELGIKGKDVTPFLLNRLHHQTNGETIGANISLLRENARLAAKISNYIVY